MSFRAIIFCVCVLGSVMLSACAPHFQLGGLGVAAPSLSKFSARMEDGTRLRVKSWRAENPEIIVLAVHGFNDHAGAFKKAAPWFAKKHVTTYAYDQRGFGTDKNRGIWASSDILASDLRTMVRLVKKQHPQLPLYVMGVSMGGAVTMKAFAGQKTSSVDGLVLVAPAVWGWRAMNPFYQASLWLTAHTIPWYSATGEGLGKQASDNIPMLRALGRDPLFIKETRIDAVYGLVGLMDEAYDLASSIKHPSLYLYGSKDEIVPPEPSKAVMAEMRGPQHKKRIYKNGWHMLLRDKQAPRVWRDILNWMQAQKAKHSPRAETGLKQKPRWGSS
jgi:alpha-beta hydrolase superfamily lysophospholipase